MNGHALLDMIEQERDGIIDLIQLLVEHESPSQDKNLVDRLGIFIAERLEQYGLFPQFAPRSKVGDILWAEWGNEIDGVEGRVLFLCHIDTVWPSGSLLANPFRLEQGKIYGPGIFDMKAGVAASLKVCEYISQGWIRPRNRPYRWPHDSSDIYRHGLSTGRSCSSRRPRAQPDRWWESSEYAGRTPRKRRLPFFGAVHPVHGDRAAWPLLFR